VGGRLRSDEAHRKSFGKGLLIVRQYEIISFLSTTFNIINVVFKGAIVMVRQRVRLLQPRHRPDQVYADQGLNTL